MDASSIPVWREYDHSSAPDLQSDQLGVYPVVVIGGGPVGLALALDLGRRGHEVTILNAMPFVASGSKAICFSKRSLDILDRLGVGERLVNKGVVWDTGKVFWRDDVDPLYTFNLLPVKEQKNPAFINIQQYYVEEYLVDEISSYDNIDIRWANEVRSIVQDAAGVDLQVASPDGSYALRAQYVVACDGSRSPTRNMLGLDFEGRVFEDNFLIADVRFKEERPAERWFRFDPPYPGWSSLIHKQPDGVWRLDFQLGWDIDKKEAVKPENVDPFVRGFLGDDIEYEYEWLSIYTFQCRRMQRFVHQRILFAGDSAHLVSPFGARGCNGGFADIDNLGWKLDMVLHGKAPQGLLETYNEEATRTADVNILHSSRATDFLTPKSAASREFRDAVLTLARHHAFARPYVNSGRLSTPVDYPDSSLNADTEVGAVETGQVCPDAPVRSIDGQDWLLSHLGDRFVAVIRSNDNATVARLRQTLSSTHCDVLQIADQGEATTSRVIDEQHLVAERLLPDEGAIALIRPDQYLQGYWCSGRAELVEQAMRLNNPEVS